MVGKSARLSGVAEYTTEYLTVPRRRGQATPLLNLACWANYPHTKVFLSHQRIVNTNKSSSAILLTSSLHQRSLTLVSCSQLSATANLTCFAAFDHSFTLAGFTQSASLSFFPFFSIFSLLSASGPILSELRVYTETASGLHEQVYGLNVLSPIAGPSVALFPRRADICLQIVPFHSLSTPSNNNFLH